MTERKMQAEAVKIQPKLQLLTKDEFARRVTLSRRQVERFIKAKKIAVIHLSPRRVAIRESELEKWIEERAARGDPEAE